MSLISNVGKIVGGAVTAVAKTTARAGVTVPLIGANIVAKNNPIVQKATALYLKDSIKDAGTTLSVAGLVAGGGAVKTAIATKSVVGLGTKLAGAGAVGATGATFSSAPVATEKAITKAPSAISKLIGLGAKNPTVAIATLSSLPLLAYGAVKASGAVTNIISSKVNKSTLDNPTVGNVPTTNAMQPYLPVAVAPKTDYALAGGTSTLPEDNNQIATPQVGEGGVPVLSKDRKKSSKRRKAQPVNIHNRVGVEVRNIYKPEVTYKKSYVRSYKHISNRS